MTITSTMILHSASSMSISWPFGGFRFPDQKVGPTPLNTIAIATSLKLVKPIINSHFQNLGRLNKSCSWVQFCLFGEGENGENGYLGKSERSNHQKSTPNPFDSERRCTNVLLALNVVMYIAQVASQGKLMFWGAKVNDLIDEGQVWRLVTSAFLHANIGHLLVNCFSLHSVGPSVEKISGAGRYLAIYFASAISCSSMSYYFSKDVSVGASGAIFGLVGSTAVFIMRHRGQVGQVGGGKGELQHIVNVIAINMVIGLLSEGIDNWGHLGGLLGGAAVSWLLGPAFDSRYPSLDGRTMFADRAPIFYLMNRKNKS